MVACYYVCTQAIPWLALNYMSLRIYSYRTASAINDSLYIERWLAQRVIPSCWIKKSLANWHFGSWRS